MESEGPRLRQIHLRRQPPTVTEPLETKIELSQNSDQIDSEADGN